MLAVFSSGQGLLHCLRRISAGKTPASPPLDLFDFAELWLESSNQGRTWFIKEHRIIERHAGIGRSYDALRRASALSTLLTRNPLPEESRPAIAALLAQSLRALNDGARPDLVWLKVLFCFARDEGYAVKQQWWPQLPAQEGAAATAILNQPIAGQSIDPAIVARLVDSLETWLRTQAEVRLP
ncbi:MAG: hypothetical protein PHQ04_07515 [Opitutaceae bacterium]|nr:hypothetical protein [Opitutaceae bacterium]